MGIQITTRIVSGQSERERVIGYLWSRTKAAWKRDDLEEAGRTHRFQVHLEGLTDTEYSKIYE